MRAYFQQRYSPENIVLVGTGRVDFDDLVRHAQERCDNWTPFPAPRDTPPAAAREDFQTRVKENATQAAVRVELKHRIWPAVQAHLPFGSKPNQNIHAVNLTLAAKRHCSAVTQQVLPVVLLKCHSRFSLAMICRPCRAFHYVRISVTTRP